ncbi:T9SS type A sorting domain-containing protein [Ferruginibacter profundus]
MKKSIFTLLIILAVQVQAQTIHIAGPAGSGQFGKMVVALTNGNYVVTDPLYDDGAVTDVGAVFLYNGITHTIISTLKGSHTGDVGDNGFWLTGVAKDCIIGLSSGNFLVLSRYWDNGTITNAGAVTWVNGTTGLSGVISSANSLVGGTVDDAIGSDGVTLLSNGNYLAKSSNWDNGATPDVGAVTWGSGTAGVAGMVSEGNSLVGTSPHEILGFRNVIALTTGNYVVSSQYWNDGTTQSVGAVTWGDGAAGISGKMNRSNSLVGSTAYDYIGMTIIALANGNYVVGSPYWDKGVMQDAGVVILGNGTTGTTGQVNSGNALTGSKTNDFIGKTIAALTNGNYVVASPSWSNGVAQGAGAVTWVSGINGLIGEVNSNNSIVGSSTGDQIGSGAGIMTLSAITPLTNGNYVVCSPNWDKGSIQNAGAITWGNGNTGTTGIVSSSNSLVGSTMNDVLGTNNTPPDHALPGVFALSNGNYVVISSFWDNGAVVDVGAATWGDGATGTTGVISSGNSLVGSTQGDFMVSTVTALSNGNYVVNSAWSSGGSHVGAHTWANGSTGVHGVINSSNSYIGGANVVPLSNGNYVMVFSGSMGAVKWVNGSSGITGTPTINASNSLVGSSISDAVGSGSNIPNVFDGVTALNNGNYLVKSSKWDNGLTTDAGAITLSTEAEGVTGIITSCNSVLGTTASGGASMNAGYNNIYDYLLVGNPSGNTVSIYFPAVMVIAQSQDSISQNIYNSATTALIASYSCRIIATITPGGSGTFNARVWIASTVPSFEDSPFVARHYQITPSSNISTATGRITLYFTQQEFDDFNAHAGSTLNLPTGDGDATGIANLRICKYPGTSSNGTGLPDTYLGIPVVSNPNDADIVWNNSLARWEVSFEVTGFGGFVVQTRTTVTPPPLPLQLLSFSAALSHNDVLVNWKTTNEVNTKNFEVERSTDGRNFITVGTVAAINTSGDHSYAYTDAGAALLNSHNIYYRLRQTDNDGSYNYSQTEVLHLSEGNSISVYPNPVTNITILSFSNTALLNTQAVLIDMQGRRVKQIIISNYQRQLDMSNLSKGGYLLKFADGSVVKLIKN